MISSRENRNGAQFLPPNWEQAFDARSNRYFYVDHNTKTTTWLNPMDRSTKPKSVSECYGDQLPYGWERMRDPVVGIYYTDHIERKNQWAHPVLVWQRRLNTLNQHHYSNSHHILSMEQSHHENSLDSNNQTTNSAASPTTTFGTGKQDISLQASASSDVERSATSLNNSNTLDTDIIASTQSNNSTRGSRGANIAGILDMMDNRFGRDSSQSVEV